MYTPRALFSLNVPFRSFSLGLYPPLRNKCPTPISYQYASTVIICLESEGKVWSVSIHKVNRIMHFRAGERKGEERRKEGRGDGKEGRGEEKGTERNLHHQIQKTWLDCIILLYLNALHFELQFLYTDSCCTEWVNFILFFYTYNMRIQSEGPSYSLILLLI